MRLQVVIQLHFFYKTGKISPLKEVLRKLSCLGLIECLGKNKSLSNTDIENCMTFIQTVLYDRNINEAYVETRTNIYDNQRTKSSMTLPPDPDSATQIILQAHYECYYATIGFVAFKKPYHQYLFKIMDGSLIASLILLGQCGLKDTSFHHR